ncbi:flagellin [Blastococcus fimeti]|nr:flagellin [Blastococcus fimeti]
MGLRVNSGLAGTTAHRHLSITSTRMDRSLERLASGLRINRAADDAAGLAIAEGLRSLAGGGVQAVRNSWDAVGLVQVADGALSETTAVLQRMRDLAVQAANDGVVGGDAQAAIQKELDQLKGQLTRIAEVTTFTGRPLLDGSYGGTIQIGPKPGDVLTVSLDGSTSARGLGVDGVNVAATTDPGALRTYPPQGRVDRIQPGQVAFLGASAAGNLGALGGTLTYDGRSLDLSTVVYADADGDGTIAVDEQVVQLNAAAAAAGFTHRPEPFVSDGDDLIFRGLEPASDATDAELAALSPGYSDPTLVELKPASTSIPPQRGLLTFPATSLEDLPSLRGRVTGNGSHLELGSVVYTDADGDGVVSGAEALGQLNAAARAAGITTEDPAFVEGRLVTFSEDEYVDHGRLLYFRGPLPADDATPEQLAVAGPTFGLGRDMISMIDDALDIVSSRRADLGALQNRLEHTIAARSVANENAAAALSRIRDADMAHEMVAFTRSDVLRQAGVAMLSQANQSTQNVVRLLQG